MGKSGYAGADWIRDALKVEMSPLGEKAADILGDVFYGIYHLDSGALKRVDWNNDHHIRFVLYGELATFDDSGLTRLVVLCHDRLVRCSLRGCSPGRMEMLFHQRQNRTGRVFEHHPTIEAAVAMVRRVFGEAAGA